MSFDLFDLNKITLKEDPRLLQGKMDLFLEIKSILMAAVKQTEDYKNSLYIISSTTKTSLSHYAIRSKNPRPLPRPQNTISLATAERNLYELFNAIMENDQCDWTGNNAAMILKTTLPKDHLIWNWVNVKRKWNKYSGFWGNTGKWIQKPNPNWISLPERIGKSQKS